MTMARKYVDVIEAEAAIKDLFADMPRIEFMGNQRRWREENEQYLRCLDAIRSVPTADAVEIKKEGEWEMFDLISSAYYGKRMYFKQDNGIVYSRYSCKYMSVDEAILEFVSLIDGTEEDDGRDKIT